MAEGNTTVADMARRRRAARVADQMTCARKSTRARETQARKIEHDNLLRDNPDQLDGLDAERSTPARLVSNSCLRNHSDLTSTFPGERRQDHVASRIIRCGFKIFPLRPAERGVAKSQSAAYISRGYDATDDFDVFRRGGNGKRPASAGAAP